MTNNDERSLDDTAVWISRKDALLNIAQNIVPEEKDIPVPDELANLTEELETALREDVVPYGKGLEGAYQFAYERQQRETCRRLLDLLVKFTGDTAAFLERSGSRIEGYSSRYLWRELLNEASTDVRTIRAAVQQRSLVGDSPSFQAKNLFMADIVSEYTLSQAVENGFLQQTPNITYMKEDISIRPVPYAEVILIGIAYATMLKPATKNEIDFSFRKVSRDLLAIPHEVGHHLYWKGRMPGKQQSVYRNLQKRLKRAKIRAWDWRRSWLEEIFCDTFGFLVAGPVMALSFQDLLTDNPPSQFREDTGEHPISALRPFMQTRILSAITDDDGNPLYKWAPIWLDEQWNKVLREDFDQEWASADPLQATYKVHGVAQPMKGRQILEALDEVIKIILKTLNGRKQRARGAYPGWNAWTTDVQKDDEELIGLYNDLSFAKFPLKSAWLQDQEVTEHKSSSENWPEQILAGWSIEGPEHDRGI